MNGRPKRRDAKDDFYLDILGGLVRLFDSPLLADLAAAVERHPKPALGHALNKNQIASKRWLIDELLKAAGPKLGTVYVLGGWMGVLGAMLLHDRRLEVERVLSFDLDPDCKAIAEAVNARHLESGRFQAVTADMRSLTYRADRLTVHEPSSGGTVRMRAQADTVINTSCEHLDDVSAWFAGLPEGILLALQSNDMAGAEGHVSCVPDLAAFRRQVPMREPLFAGALPRKRYTRFMLIGRK